MLLPTRHALLLTALAALLLTGCGYQLSSMAPITLPKEQTRLYIAKVTNPTIESWIEPRLRSSLRDELTRRGGVQWVERNQAETEVEVIIHSFSTSSSVKGEDDETVRSSASITLEIQLFDRQDHAMLWTSGPVSGQESYSGDSQQEEAAFDAMEEVIRKSADRLSDQF
ncbi:MAG TPA: LPS assembly lipoprotein LptE [Desulfomicrobiaceae bacterium]|nr:LPS assembly lipoprotein LptE [Desulfomicrobiaceae bacterium]